MSTKCVVLDADNCLFLDEKTGEGSEEIKDEAWYSVFPEYSRETLDSAMRAAKENLASFTAGQADRQDLVREVCRYFRISNEQVEDEVVRRRDHFNRVVQEGIRQIGMPAQKRAALVQISGAMPIYVNTATPLDAARESLDALGLSPLLKGMYGRPGTKLGNLQEIIRVEGLDPTEVLVVDDQPTGWSVAQQLGCRFVGIRTERNRAWHDTPQPFPIIRSLSELPALILSEKKQ